MQGGETAIVRQSKHGVMGVWKIVDTNPVNSQEDHNWPEEYDQFVYCNALHKELSPPVDDTEFFDGEDFVRFNTGANKLSDDDTERFLTHILDRSDLSDAARERVRSELSQIGSERIAWETGNQGWQTEPGSGGPQGPSVDHEEQSADIQPPEHTETTVSRVVRNTQIAKDLKKQYDYRCQVCGEQRQRDSGNPYAEAHHIHPLGDTPSGIDHRSNILVLCPNHHSDFDYGSIKVDPETLEITHAYERKFNRQTLFLDEDHSIDTEHLRYHNDEISTV
ncbi:HNH endonuclease [Halostella sp. PRR32]|uniref:HNH endonuclease n=1 Tax=Halostella sp. PRR32 TaxID=3098147 RepID=UPI002B1D1ECA|nr:HNH endonuclease [Halostella sp. PRR32]